MNEAEKMSGGERQARANEANGGKNGLLLVVLSAILICCLILFACIGSFVFLGSLDAESVTTSSDGQFSYNHVYGDETSDNRYLSVVIAGPIYTNSDTDGIGFSLLGSTALTYGYDVKETLYRAAEDDSIDGIILEINSPGGTITGSQAISDGVDYYREQTGNPVIAHCSGLCASGSYWAAISADHIILDAGSLTGSIGVLYGPFQYYDTVLEEGSFLGSVLTQNGIETDFFVGGEYKDNGSPYRRLTEEEIELVQANVDEEYNKFVSYVAERRELSETEIREDVKALVYSNDIAIELGLADETGNREYAYDDLAERDEVDLDDYQIIREAQILGFWDEVFATANGNDDELLAELKSQQELNNQVSCQLCDVPVYFHGNPRTAIF
jgi:protease-4